MHDYVVLNTWLADLEVERDEGEDEAAQVLHQVVEGAQAVGVVAVLHVQQRADLGALPDTGRQRRQNRGLRGETWNGEVSV